MLQVVEAVGALAAVDVDDLDVDSRLGLLDGWESVSRVLGAVGVRVLGSVDRSGVCEERFGMTTAAFCEQRHGVDRASVRDRLRVGRSLSQRLPVVFDAFCAGALSWDRARLLAGVVNARNADALAAAQDQILVLSDAEPSFKIWAALVRDLARYADVDGTEPDEPSSRAGSHRSDDTLVLDVCFVGDDAESFDQLVEAHTDRLWRAYTADHDRCADIEVPTRVELRAEAILDLVRHGAAAIAERAGRRPVSELSLVVDADRVDELDPLLAAVLDGVGPARHTQPFEHRHHGCGSSALGGLIGVPVTTTTGTRMWFTPTQWQLLVCHSDISEVLLDHLGMPVAVRDRLRHPTREMRRAIEIRDGGCVFPGCDRPPGWCDAHHVIEWADGGDTVSVNLVLLCRRHHGIIHRTGWHITRTPSVDPHGTDGNDGGPGGAGPRSGGDNRAGDNRTGEGSGDGLFTITTPRGLTMTTRHRRRPPKETDRPSVPA